MMSKDVLGTSLALARGIVSASAGSDNPAAAENAEQGLQKCKDEAEVIIDFLKTHLQIDGPAFTIVGTGGQVK